jgi:hypothetical protein
MLKILKQFKREQCLFACKYDRILHICEEGFVIVVLICFFDKVKLFLQVIRGEKDPFFSLFFPPLHETYHEPIVLSKSILLLLLLTMYFQLLLGPILLPWPGHDILLLICYLFTLNLFLVVSLICNGQFEAIPFDILLCGLIRKIRSQQGHLIPSYLRNISHSVQRLHQKL